MALTRGFIRNAVTTPLDARLMDMARVVGNADGSPRVGVLDGDGRAIVTALATMNVAIAAADFVTSKGTADGVAIFTNDGTVNVAITAAPASNSRIDVIWVKHNDNTTGDANSTPVFGVTAGTAAASPTKPTIPTGALELATLRVYAGTTAANGGLNTLTNTYQMTAAAGGAVPFRTKSDLLLWTNPLVGQVAFVLDVADFFTWRAGAWDSLLGDTGWLNMTLFSGWSVAVGEPPKYRVKNGFLSCSGRVSAGAGVGANFAQLPSFARHTSNNLMVWRTHMDNAIAGITAGQDGTLGCFEPGTGASRPGVSLAPIHYPVG